MIVRAMLFATVILTAQTAFCQQPSGNFTAEGWRIEDEPARNGAPGGKPILEWGRFIISARSTEVRNTGSEQFFYMICRYVEKPGERVRLQEAEIVDARTIGHEMLAARDPTVRRRGAEVLRYVGNDASIEPLLIAIRDADRQVQVSAANALAVVGDESCAKPLTAVFLKSADDDVRKATMNAVGVVGSEATRKNLLGLERKFGNSGRAEYIRQAIDAIDSRAKNPAN